MLIFRFLLVALVFFVWTPASATDWLPPAEENVWMSTPLRITYRGEGYSDRVKQADNIGEHLFTTSPLEPGLYFRCLNGALRAGIVTEAQDLRFAFSNLAITGVSGGGSFVPMRSQLDNLSVKFNDGKRERLGQWLSYKNDTVFMSRDRKSTAMLYNAVVKGETIEIFVNRKQATRLTIPVINDDFRDFGSACGIGRLRPR